MPDATIPAAEFKARCLSLLDQVATTHEPLTVTKHGRPIARLVPLPSKTGLYGAMAGSLLEEGDLVSPVDESWAAQD